MNGALYFGCWQIAGHVLHDEKMRGISWRSPEAPPWTAGELDGGLCPPTDRNAERRAQWPESDEAAQPQGKALVHHRDGWTALAFWDRTGDSRGNSNSVFLLPAVLEFPEALAAARETFPQLFARFTFEVVPDA